MGPAGRRSVRYFMRDKGLKDVLSSVRIVDDRLTRAGQLRLKICYLTGFLPDLGVSEITALFGRLTGEPEAEEIRAVAPESRSSQ